VEWERTVAFRPCGIRDIVLSALIEQAQMRGLFSFGCEADRRIDFGGIGGRKGLKTCEYLRIFDSTILDLIGWSAPIPFLRMAGRRYTGHCHCGAVTYAIDFKEGDSFRESPEYDFCVSCRRVAGSLLVLSRIPRLLITRLVGYSFSPHSSSG